MKRNMKINFHITIIFFFMFLLAGGPLVRCDDGQEFKKHNPDGNKYEFVRSYVSGMSYVDRINKRWQAQNPKERFKDDPQKMFQAYVEYLALDNTELRIAKNFLTKYFNGNNDLMRKAADTFIATCEQLIEINRQERVLWQEFYKVRRDKKENVAAEEKVFVENEKNLNIKRQDISKTFIESALLTAHVMQSENSYVDAPYQLALTEEQRRKLIKRIDEFAKDNVDWGIKSGQSTFQASIAAIREILEDPIWKSALK